MPDARNQRDESERPQAGDWAAAFAALPEESPAGDGWQRLQARLPVRQPVRVRTRVPLWLAGVAAAAAIVLAVAIPLRMLPDVGRIADAPTVTAPTTPRPERAIDVSVAGKAAVDAPPIDAVATAGRQTAVRTDAGDKEPTPRLVAGSNAPASIARTAPTQSNNDDPARQASAAAATPGDTALVAADTPSPDTEDASSDATRLEALYAQSAQLESLLALARDDRVSSGMASALSDGMTARLAGIDAALIQPGLDAQQRADLWGERVAALQQLVGIETTQRLYAARGQHYQAALVSID